jgi:hypothetical protein
MSDNRDKSLKRHVMPDHFEKVSIYLIKKKVIKINSYYLGNAEHVSFISYRKEAPKTGVHRVAIVQGDGQWFSPIDTHLEYKLNDEMQVTEFNYIRTPHPVSPKCAIDEEGKKVYVCYISLLSNSSARPRLDFKSLNSDFANLGFTLSERPKRIDVERPGSSSSISKPGKSKPFKYEKNKDFPPLSKEPLKPLVGPKPPALDTPRDSSSKGATPKTSISESVFCKWLTLGLSPSMSNPISSNPDLWVVIEKALIAKGLTSIGSLSKGSRQLAQPSEVMVISSNKTKLIGTGRANISQTCTTVDGLPFRGWRDQNDRKNRTSKKTTGFMLLYFQWKRLRLVINMILNSHVINAPRWTFPESRSSQCNIGTEVLNFHSRFYLVKCYLGS